jgi:hypothetical protein
MILRQKLNKAINGYWDGGARDTFDWEIDGRPQTDNKGKFVRIGSWMANHWFHVAVGKTDRQTLSYAKKHLKASTRVSSTFEYIDS